MADKMSETVLCFPRSLLTERGVFQGISRDVSRYFPDIVSRPYCQYVARGRAENDPNLKQVIPYVLITCGDMVFTYRRGKRGSENRLHGLYSIGIGGHIRHDDRRLFSEDSSGYSDAVWREVYEEVAFDCPHKEAIVAVINDDTTPVGQVHFGVVHVIALERLVAAKNESAITDAGFVPVEKAVKDAGDFETWSQLCLAQTEPLLTAAAESFSRQEWRSWKMT